MHPITIEFSFVGDPYQIVVDWFYVPRAGDQVSFPQRSGVVQLVTWIAKNSPAAPTAPDVFIRVTPT